MLIGNPVDRSLSHLTHPEIFRRHHIRATYEKRLIRSEDEIRKLKGEKVDWIAVTMPYKETVVPYMDELDDHARAIGAVNMIHAVDGKWVGYNTDATGCLNAIERVRKVEGKKVLILGAGGVAKAVAYEAHRRGARVALYNRTQGKVKLLVEKWGLECVKAMPHPYDILINATSVGMDSHSTPINPEFLIPGSLVLDVVYSPPRTALLREAAKRGCQVISGLEMFRELTFDQLSIVFGPIIQREIMEAVICEEIWKG